MYLTKRLDFLKSTQNADGGWGYFPGKSSWLEPTAYAMLALHGDVKAAGALEKGWALVRSWQLPDGAWRPSGAVWQPHWSGALVITISTVRGARGGWIERGIDSLLKTEGAEGGMFRQAVRRWFPAMSPIDPSLLGWPWRPGNTSWIEPTAHTLVALKRVAREAGSPTLWRRIREGERMILDRRCHDGGWNFGSPSVYGVDLPSYEESTGLALLGLQGLAKPVVAEPLANAARLWRETRSAVAKAWLEISLRNYGWTLPEKEGSAASGKVSNDTMVVALEALACAEGNHRFLGPGAKA
jgi:hypothetical protein